MESMDMKPVLRKEMIEVEYWDCGNPEHRHKTEKTAMECVKKAAWRDKHSHRSALSRAIKAMRAVIGGATWSVAAEIVGVTTTTGVKNAVWKVMRRSLYTEGGYLKHSTSPRLDNLRGNAEFWLERLDALEKRL